MACQYIFTNDIGSENNRYLTCSDRSLVTRAVDTASNVALSFENAAYPTNDRPLKSVIDSIVSTWTSPNIWSIAGDLCYLLLDAGSPAGHAKFHYFTLPVVSHGDYTYFTCSWLSFSWTVVNTDSNVALSPLNAARASNECPSESLRVSIVSTWSEKQRLAPNRWCKCLRGSWWIVAHQRSIGGRCGGENRHLDYPPLIL